MTDPVKAITSGTSPAELIDRKKAAELARVLHEQDLIWLLSDPRGKRLALAWIAQTGALALGFHPELSQMAYQQGRRAVGVEFMADIKKNVPQLYPGLFIDA
jgi:hypothetical protein